MEFVATTGDFACTGNADHGIGCDEVPDGGKVRSTRSVWGREIEDAPGTPFADLCPGRQVQLVPIAALPRRGHRRDGCRRLRRAGLTRLFLPPLPRGYAGPTNDAPLSSSLGRGPPLLA